MKTFLLIVSLFFVGLVHGQGDTTSQGGDYFLTFVKKVYLNPTVYLRCQQFKETTNVGFVALPDLSSAHNNASTGFEKGLQKLLRLLMQTDGGIRFYFNPDTPTAPFTFWNTDNLNCKFKQPQKDSIQYYLNHHFSDGNLDLNNNQRFESTIDETLDYIQRVLAANTAECGDDPQNETNTINTKPLAINLHNTSGSKYDIDYKNYNELASSYGVATNQFTHQDWYAPSKMFVTGGGPEPVTMSINLHEPQFKKENLKIEILKSHTVLQFTYSNDSVRFNLPGDLLPSDPVEVVVTYKSQVDSVTYTVGFFMVNVVAEQQQKVVLLGANGYVIGSTDVTNVQNYLNKIYKPAGVAFEVSKDTYHFVDDYPTLIEDKESGLVANYPPDLHDYVGDVKDLENYNSDNYYLVLGLNSSNSDLRGYMPRARNVGFIFFREGSSAYKVETVAHELGHGVFHFRHIFDEEELGENYKGSTHNIMDDSTVSISEALYVHQWNFIQDPSFVSWFDGDDEDGSSVTINLTSEIFQKFGNPIDGSVTFLSPAGKPITLPKEISEVRFSLPDDRWVVSVDGQSIPAESPYVSVGSVIGFKIDGVDYSSHVNSGNTNFLGYENDNGRVYKDKLSKKLASFIPVVVTPVYTNTGFSVTVSQTNLSKASFNNIADSNDATGALADMYSNFNVINKNLLSAGVTTSAVSFSTDFSTETIDVLNNLIFTEGSSEVNNSGNVISPSIPALAQQKFIGLDATTLYIAGINLQNLSDYGTCLTHLDRLITSGAFQTIVRQNDEEFEKGFYERIDASPIVKYSDRLKPKPLDRSQRVQFFTSADEANFASLRLKMLFLSLREYNKFAAAFINNQPDIEASLSVETINILIALYEAAETTQTGMGDCLLEMISAPAKLELLKKSSEWTIGDSKEGILIKIIQHTSTEQFIELYPKLIENGYEIIHDLEADIWWSQYDEFANALTLKMVDYHDYLGYDPDNLPVFELYKDNLTPDILDNYSSAEFDDDGIQLRSDVNGFNNNISISDIDPDKLYRFVVQEDFTFPGYTGNIIKEGDTLIAPAYWAYYILNEEKESVNWYVARKTIEVLLIVGTAGEALPAVIYIEAAFATSDFIITVARDYDPNSQELREIQSAFNTIYMVYGVGSLARLGLNVNWITQIAKGKQFVYKIYQSGFPSLLKELKKLPAALSKQKIDDLISSLDELIVNVSNYVMTTASKGFLVQYFQNCKTLAKFSKYYESAPYCKFVVKNNELSLVFTQDLHGISKGSIFKVSNITEDANDLVLSNLNVYLKSNDGEIILDDIIELSSIRVKQTGGSVLEKEYRIVITNQGKVRLISKAGLESLNGSSALVQSLSPELKSIHFRLVSAGVPVFEQGNVIKYVTINGNEFAKIENGVFSVTMPKLSIPLPSTYLDAVYMTNHINKFKNEGAGFVVIKSWTEGGDPIYTTLPARKFVGLRSEMDAVISKYRAQGNDWTVLRDELNLGPATNLANEEIYYIKINGNDPRFSFDVPNGNEKGAIPGEWVPGGYTKSGTAEAALVGAENIIHNKSMDQLLSNFPGMWEKIK